MSQAENPDLLQLGQNLTVDQIRELTGAATPHFALQIRERLKRLISCLPSDHPAKVYGEREIARLAALGTTGSLASADESI